MKYFGRQSFLSKLNIPFYSKAEKIRDMLL